VPIRTIQAWLGHKNLGTTMIFPGVTDTAKLGNEVDPLSGISSIASVKVLLDPNLSRVLLWLLSFTNTKCFVTEGLFSQKNHRGGNTVCNSNV
jgi:hypothetical protein